MQLCNERRGWGPESPPPPKKSLCQLFTIILKFDKNTAMLRILYHIVDPFFYSTLFVGFFCNTPMDPPLDLNQVDLIWTIAC